MKEHWKYIPRDEKGRFTKGADERYDIYYFYFGMFIFLIIMIIIKCNGGIPDIMTYKDLILKDGSIYCKACGEGMSFNMEVRGSLEFGLKLEVNEILMDEPNFQYSYAEATSDEFYCNNCGAHYQGAKALFNGNTALNEKEMDTLINSNKEE